MLLLILILGALSVFAGRPLSGEYYIQDSGWSCDHASYTDNCHQKLSGGSKGMWFDGNNYKWTLERLEDSTYKIYSQGHYWTADAENVGTDWMQWTSTDYRDTYRLADDPDYPGAYQIYPMRNCDKAGMYKDWPCGQIVTFEHWGGYYLKTDEGTDIDNQVSFKFIKA